VTAAAIPPPSVTDTFNDNTRISAYKDCPRKFFLRHIMEWRSEGTAVPLVFGGSWHAGQDIIWQHATVLQQDDLRQAAMAAFLEKWEEEGFPADLDMDQIQAFNPRTPGVAEEMYANYIRERWGMLLNARIVSIEQPFAVPLPNLDHSWYVGRLDKVIEYNGQQLVIEHKTTALYSKASGFQPSYIDSWYVDSQVKGYQFGAGMYYEGLKSIWVDCALVHKVIHDQFRFVPVSHTFDMVKEWLRDTESWVTSMVKDEQRFLDTGNLSTTGCFRKNENSCYGKYGSCAFLDICRTTSDIQKGQEPPPGYIVEKWSPFETLGLEKIINKE